MTALGKNCFNKNMALLEKHHPEVFKMMSGNQNHSDNTELFFAENKKPNLKVNISETESVVIHDNEDPGAEAEGFLSLVDVNSTGVIFMFGMGLGYSVLELLEKRKKIQHFVIFELNIDFFRFSLEQMNLETLLTDSRVMICLEKPSDLLGLIAPIGRSLMLEDIHRLNLMSCFQLDKAYSDLSSQVLAIINSFNSEGTTKIIHGRTFFENRLKHLTSMHHDRKLEELADKFKGVPALLVAAGPSLDKNIEMIARARGRALIFCVDSALSNLLEHGIIPDFVTSIDYQEATYEKIAGCASKSEAREISLICMSWVTDRVPKTFPAKNIFWAFGNNAFENWINILMGGKMATPGAGTVAHLNFIAANDMGCDPIIFVGQDLAFSGNKDHSKNVVLTNRADTAQRLAANRDIMWVKGGVEKEVPTTRQLYGYLRLFENMIKATTKTIINSTEGGVLIEGAENKPLSQVIDEYCDSEVLIELGDTVLAPIDPLKSIKAMQAKVKKLEKIIKRTEKLSGPVRKELFKLKKASKSMRSFSDLPESVQKKISDFDVCQKKADQDDLWPFFDEMTMEVLRHSEREKNEIDRLEGFPEKYFQWLYRGFERISKINSIRMENLGWFKKQLDDIASYYQKEKSYMEQLDKKGPSLKIISELAEMYHQSGNYILLEKMLSRHVPDIENKSLIEYHLGVVALYQRDYDVAANRFQTALQHDALYAEKIKTIQNEIGDYFLGKINHYKGMVCGALNSIVRGLLLNGLTASPDHDGLKNVLQQFAQDDFKKIEQTIIDNNGAVSDSIKDLLRKWVDLIGSEAGGKIADYLDKALVCQYFLKYGKVLIDEQNLHDALKNFKRASQIIPDNPEIYISLTDISFSLKEFDSGIQFLKTAVGIDKQYAVYWLNMGRNLQSQEDYTSAILAFEQYFIALPENIAILKDIGDCHAKLGNLEAARQAYEEFKKLFGK